MNEARPARGDEVTTGPAVPPMANGELVFEAPWQSRVFGMARALCEAGLFSWDEFRAALMAEIARWEAAAPAGTPYHYYERFLTALQALLAARGVCSPDELEARLRRLADRPPGHDHAPGALHAHEREPERDPASAWTSAQAARAPAKGRPRV